AEQPPPPDDDDEPGRGGIDADRLDEPDRATAARLHGEPLTVREPVFPDRTRPAERPVLRRPHPGLPSPSVAGSKHRHASLAAVTAPAPQPLWERVAVVTGASRRAGI